MRPPPAERSTLDGTGDPTDASLLTRLIYRDAVTDASASQSGQSSDGDLRVSDSERDDTIELLAAAATDGRLTLDEYGDRTGKALTAVTRDDLAVVTTDLEDPRSRARLVDDVSPARPERIVAIFSSERRQGRWAVPARLTTNAVFGECRLDLQDATLHARVTVLGVKAMFGSVEILVPEGVQVQMTGASIFGSRSCSVERDTHVGAPVIEVRGRALFGEITVRHPPRPNTA